MRRQYRFIRFQKVPPGSVATLDVNRLSPKDREQFSAGLRRNEIVPLSGDGDMKEAPSAVFEGEQ